MRERLPHLGSVTPLPRGFRAYATNIGIKDDTNDFVVVASETRCVASGVFTKSSFAGPSVVVSREAVADGRAQAVVVISKNANVATGPAGLENARAVVAGVATALGVSAGDVAIASTGVIGRQYPMERVRAGLAAIPAELPATDADAVADAIMTTDTVPKIASTSIGGATIVGVAKGVGMIEPDMATLITLFFTDASLPGEALDTIFRRVMDRTFNCVSVDTDTSTSDTAIILANGAADVVSETEFEDGLFEVAKSLTQQVARDGEGAEKLIEVTPSTGRRRTGSQSGSPRRSSTRRSSRPPSTEPTRTGVVSPWRSASRRLRTKSTNRAS